MKFSNHMAAFAFRDWSVTVWRRRTGNRLSGYSYAHSFTAHKLVKDGDRWRIVAEVEGFGQKRKAIAAINKFEHRTQEV